jgi:hypothetical protein
MAFNLKGGLYGEKKETLRLQADATSLADLKVNIQGFGFLCELFLSFKNANDSPIPLKII